MDRVEIIVQGGDGGNGMVSFHHEKFVAFGGPDGGNGGDGGNVYVAADESVASLEFFRHKRRFKAESGKNGGKQKKHGAKGGDLIISVPLGTVIFFKAGDQGVLLADLSKQGQKILVAKGGGGGLGNARFATARNQAPRIATEGRCGEERQLILELKIIADVGIIGFPNVGKSTLLAAVSSAKPKVADYPFTTCEPVLGVVEVGTKAFVMAEIPAIVEGAHLGKGLGHEFLRHAERAKILLHVLDGSSLSIIDDMSRLNAELALCNPALAQQTQLVVVNKMDLTEVRVRLSEIKQVFEALGTKVFFISAITKQGVPELISEVAEMLEDIQGKETVSKMPMAVFRPKPKLRRVK